MKGKKMEEKSNNSGKEGIRMKTINQHLSSAIKQKQQQKNII